MSHDSSSAKVDPHPVAGATPVARPLVVIAETIDDECARWLEERARVVHAAPGDAAFAGALREADALLVRTYVRVDAALLDAGPRLRVVARAGVGLDNIDLAACADRSIRVVSTPGANTDAVVEFVLACILDHTRPREALTRALDTPAWHAARQRALAPRQLTDMTLSILGLGRVGSSLARVAAALKMRVLYHDLLDIPNENRHGATPTSLESLFAEGDIVSIHVDGRPSNRGFLGGGQFALLKPDALFINTSRGMIVDADALAGFLRGHPDAHSVLDVHEPEPIEAGNPLLGVANARLTPHIASATRTAKRAMSWVVRDLWGALQT